MLDASVISDILSFMQITYVEDLLKRIDGFLASNPMGEQYFGKLAAKDSDLIPRLRRGGWCSPIAAGRAHKFMDEYVPKRKKREREAAE